MKNILNLLIIIPLGILLTSCSHPIPRSTENFNDNWKFALGNFTGAEQTEFIDSTWRSLDLPHDWSIEGEFSDTNPVTVKGGALPAGTGWYRKTFTPVELEKNCKYYIQFDGVYMNSTVWLNGHILGNRPNGYISFRYDITEWLLPNAPNVLVVKADNSQQPNSRWYSGSGIYRNVWFIKTSALAVDQWGTYVTTPDVNDINAKVVVQTQIRNDFAETKNFKFITSILNQNGQKIASVNKKLTLQPNTLLPVSDTLNVDKPMLWSLNEPTLYTAVTQIFVDGQLLDHYSTVFGIRYFEFSINKGFLLNGKPVKINGVCNHHDLGCLGTAINNRALERQLEMLKAMGCNSIRTSHNPPAPELLDLCDRMGILVMDEMFDMWKISKNPHDFSNFWDEWHEKDLKDFIVRDRNHPSIIVWSIGNEIPEQWDSTGTKLAGELVDIVKSLDTTRPITSACNDPRPSNFIIKSGKLDLIGFNYNHESFADFPKNFPGQKFIATETVSSLNTRGHYDQPSDSIRIWPTRWDLPIEGGNIDNTCSAYDNCRAPWGSTHEATLKVMKKHEFLSGMYIWTGWDYLGEPTPYFWPSRSSYFGIIDLAGFPKDIYYMYQSEWTQTPVLHIFPHWNWNYGDKIDVWAYFNCDEVELFLNGKSLGTKKKMGDDLHSSWKVTYEPGVLKAIGRNKGEDVIVKEINTAGVVDQLKLSADRTEITADGYDLSFVTVEILDAEGNTVPTADNMVEFKIEGPGSIAGVDNGNQTSHEPFKANYRKAFNGKCLVVIKSSKSKGNIVLTSTSEGLKSFAITLISK